MDEKEKVVTYWALEKYIEYLEDGVVKNKSCDSAQEVFKEELEIAKNALSKIDVKFVNH